MTSKYGPGRHDDYELWEVILLPLLGAAALLWLLASLTDIAGWLADHGILTRTDILIPIAAGAGLDLPRTAVLAAILIVLAISAGILLRLFFPRTSRQEQP